MAKVGRLTKEKYGYSMPVDAPLFCKPPIYYKNAEAIAFSYETDEDSAADILPEGLELTSPPTATVLFLRYPFSTLGVYDEVILGLGCTWQGSPRFYIAHIVVDSDVPLNHLPERARPYFGCHGTAKGQPYLHRGYSP